MSPDVSQQAKNFSIALHTTGGFGLTPLYDVMSAQPLFAAGQLQQKDLRLAMAIGNKRHYRLHEIMPRHFEQTAARAGLPPEAAGQLLAELFEAVPAAIETVCAKLPEDFPPAVCDPIFDGFNQRLTRLNTASA